MQTRPANADQHPGQVVVKRKRWTKAEMDTARTEEQASQDEKEKLKAELMKSIAHLEDELAQKNAKDWAGQEHPHPQPKAVASASVSKRLSAGREKGLAGVKGESTAVLPSAQH
jgi:hypothetical protein